MADVFNDSCLVIASDGNAYHPVATNHFTVTITLPDTLINYADPNQGLISDTLADSVLILKVANDTIAEPSFTQNTISYQKGNLKINYPGSMEAFTSTAKFHVFVTKSAYDVLYSWKMASGNHLTGEVGDPDDYWAEVQIDITTGNKGTLVGTWNLHKCWISSLSGVTFSNSANEAKTCEITIQYFRPEYQGAQYETE